MIRLSELANATGASLAGRDVGVTGIAVDSRQVRPGEAVKAVLREKGIAYHYEATLAEAVRRVLEGCDAGDLVLLLGAQGMDQAAGMARGMLPEG